MTVNSVDISVGDDDSVALWPGLIAGQARLVIDTGCTHCEIAITRAHVEILRDEIPAILAAGQTRAETTAHQAIDATGEALRVAAAAETAGATDLADTLRSAAVTATAHAEAVRTAIHSVENATAEADQATQNLITTINRTRATLPKSTLSEGVSR